ncbi:uncharacterized protein [Rutidosis leptorrhynchoides]|uniref:uncharacterized protein n=1 Tax=Rutidosis leptorrhynchoides TaxID=125765 RepID=UPI003A99448E
MAPYEMLYGRKCRALVCGNEPGEKVIEGPELVRVINEKVELAKEKLKEARTRQKSYADKHRRALEFKVGEHVFLKVSTCKGIRRFGIKGKLSPRFIGPFEILERVGEVSYRLALPPALLQLLSTPCGQYPLHEIREDLSCEEEAQEILAREERVLRHKTIPYVKVLCKNHPEREATWESEESIRERYPSLFA